MRKLFLLGTMLGVATTALAFGGVFSHGNKSTTYKGGVDAIGVHFGGEKKTSDSEQEGNTDEHDCPVHSTYSEQYDQCFCEFGYYMFNQKCQPTKTTCESQGGYWCINGEYSTCEKDEAACYALCPEDKKCNGTCCTYGNTCHHEGDIYQCCNDEVDECCDASESIGYIGYHTNRCIPLTEVCCNHNQPDNPYLCMDIITVYKKFYSAGTDFCKFPPHGNEYCQAFDESGNCTSFTSSTTGNPMKCYWKDSNGHCRIVTTKCPEGEFPYCPAPWKSIDSAGTPSCNGPGYFCCSGKVTYGEGATPDTCEE